MALWVLVFAAAGALAAWVAAPLVQRRMAAPQGDSALALARLVARREEILALLQELERDARDGRLAAADVDALRQDLMREGEAVLTEIEAWGAE